MLVMHFRLINMFHNVLQLISHFDALYMHYIVLIITSFSTQQIQHIIFNDFILIFENI